MSIKGKSVVMRCTRSSAAPSHNLHVIRRRLRLLYALILIAASTVTQPVHAGCVRSASGRSELFRIYYLLARVHVVGPGFHQWTALL